MHLRRTIIASLLFLTIAQRGEAFAFQPPADRTGAPGSSTTCMECHFGTGNGTLSIQFSGASNTYVPSESYTLQVMIQDAGQSRFGFSMVAREEATPTMHVGTWLAGPNSGVYDSGEHIGHRSAPFANDSHIFEVTWTAPSSDVGAVTFYAAANAANGNGTNGEGDNIYLNTLTVQPASAADFFWADSPPFANGWRYSGEGYDNHPGIGWIWDSYWPWIYTLGHGSPADGDWVYIQVQGGGREGFWGYNADEGYWFWGVSAFGWYYSFEAGNDGWFPYNL